MPLLRTLMIAGLVATSAAETLAQTTDAAPTSARTVSKLQASTSLAPMLERVLPGVVSILVVGERETPMTLGQGATAEPAAKQPFQAGGSGVIVHADTGVILTNNHVIADATKITIILSDGRTTEAKLLGTDAATDVAVLQVPLRDLAMIPLGNSDELRIGDFISAVGAPFGLEGSASQGIVSALMRTDIGYEIFEDFIQIDAAVNPGNSGGALVDIDGRLVGINTASGSAKTAARGISFAIPINLARSVGEELIDKGTFKRGSLGIVTESLTFDKARQMNLGITRGATVTSVLAGSPAAQAGIKSGDVITGMSHKPIRGHADYAARVATTPIGMDLAVELLSDGAKKNLTLKVAALAIEPTPEPAPKTLPSLAGMTLGVMLPGFEPFGKVQGARVLSSGSGVIAKAGLKADDVITKVDMATTRSPEDVYEYLASKMGRYRLEVYRDGRKLWIWGEN